MWVPICPFLFVSFLSFSYIQEKMIQKRRLLVKNNGFDQKEHQQLEWLKNKDEKGRKEQKIGAAKI